MDRSVGTERRDDAMTSGSDSRSARDLADPLVLDIAAEAGTLFDEREWAERDRNSRTIATTERMRITVTALRSGAELGSEGTDDTLAVQVLRGAVGLEVDARSVDLRAGQLATVSNPGHWRLRATDDCLLLLTVALASGTSGGD